MVEDIQDQLISPRRVAGLSALVGDYDLILCDVWGVLHNGTTRPGPFVMTMLDGLGVPRTAYDGIVTSGDVTRAMLATHAGSRVYHLGPARDLGTFDGLGLIMTGQDDAQIVVCTGLLDDTVETPEDYVARLTAMRERDLTFICANPDIVVERGDQLIYCAGAIAKVYEEMGGKTVYCGKPHLPIYQEALAQATALRPGLAAARVLCIGDALRTDILGATAAGLDSLFLAGGIHAEELGAEGGSEPSERALAELFAGHAHPRGVMPRLAW
ncbi:MAG: HAD family hydrolase [Rhizobiales bacterium 32-66-8]|nr:MAG: HAD family hydrolase [Rhizobiales bacterium 32-66-8]